MTSFMIEQFIGRPGYELKDECVFCQIIQRKQPAHLIYEDEYVMAFLDTLPIRPGHTLLVPKAHHARLTELPKELGSALGAGLTHIGDALTKALDNPNINFVCNQGYAQAVHHVHFHLVPAPIFKSASYADYKAVADAVTAATTTPSNSEDALSSATNGDATTNGAKAFVPTSAESAAKPTKQGGRTPPTTEAIFKMERDRREELDEDDAVKIAERIRSRL